MRFCDLVEVLQQKDEGYIVFVNSGAFYIAVGKDALLLNKILDLKLSCMNKKVCKVGFPKNALNKYKTLLMRHKYCFVVYELDFAKSDIKEIEKYEGQLKNEIKETHKDCYICKHELNGYTEKENKYIKVYQNLRKREQNEGK